jgi:hypothetical protein
MITTRAPVKKFTSLLRDVPCAVIIPVENRRLRSVAFSSPMMAAATLAEPSGAVRAGRVPA